jgi:hypothetical protein
VESLKSRWFRGVSPLEPYRLDTKWTLRNSRKLCFEFGLCPNKGVFERLAEGVRGRESKDISKAVAGTCLPLSRSLRIGVNADLSRTSQDQGRQLQSGIAFGVAQDKGYVALHHFATKMGSCSVLFVAAVRWR